MKRTPQLTLTFPKKDKKYKEELIRMKEEEDLNVSAYIISCLKKELGCI
jgi:hypothetical protein